MTMPQCVDVLVIGMGPVGATIANLLGRYSIQTLVVEQATEIFNSPRAIALDNEALRILQMAGVTKEDFATVPIPQEQMHSPIFGKFARANTSDMLDGHP